MLDDALILKSLLRDKSVIVFFSLTIPDACLSFIMDPLSSTDFELRECYNELRKRKDKEEKMIQILSSLFKLSGIVFLSPSLADFFPDNVEKVDFLGDARKHFCIKCGRSFPSHSAPKICPACGSPITPMFSNRMEWFSRRIDRAVRISMSSDSMLVLGKADQLLPGALIPWVSKVFGGVELIVVSEAKSQLMKVADEVIEREPVELILALESK
ncbi:MAG: hypothetical protein QW039_02485 [Fervidicoccaceae archaeon]